jgi:hypothetical protein
VVNSDGYFMAQYNERIGKTSRQRFPHVTQRESIEKWLRQHYPKVVVPARDKARRKIDSERGRRAVPLYLANSPNWALLLRGLPLRGPIRLHPFTLCLAQGSTHLAALASWCHRRRSGSRYRQRILRRSAPALSRYGST